MESLFCVDPALLESGTEDEQRDLLKQPWKTITQGDIINYPDPAAFFMGPHREDLGRNWQQYYAANHEEPSDDLFKEDCQIFNSLKQFLYENGLQDYFDWVSYSQAHPTHILPFPEDLESQFNDASVLVNHIPYLVDFGQLPFDSGPFDYQDQLSDFALLENQYGNLATGDLQLTEGSLMNTMQPLLPEDNFGTNDVVFNQQQPFTQNAFSTSLLPSNSRTLSGRWHPSQGPMPHLLTSPFPEHSSNSFSPRDLEACLDAHIPLGTTFDSLSDCTITYIHAVAGSSVTLRSIVRRRLPNTPEKVIEKTANRMSMREQRFRNEHGILMGAYRTFRTVNGKSEIEPKTKMKLERLSEAQLLHQTWGVIDFDNWTYECGGVAYQLEEPKEVPDKIQHTMRSCGLKVPDLKRYLERNPRVRERFRMGDGYLSGEGSSLELQRYGQSMASVQVAIGEGRRLYNDREGNIPNSGFACNNGDIIMNPELYWETVNNAIRRSSGNPDIEEDEEIEGLGM